MVEALWPSDIVKIGARCWHWAAQVGYALFLGLQAHTGTLALMAYFGPRAKDPL